MTWRDQGITFQPYAHNKAWTQYRCWVCDTTSTGDVPASIDARAAKHVATKKHKLGLELC